MWGSVGEEGIRIVTASESVAGPYSSLLILPIPLRTLDPPSLKVSKAGLCGARWQQQGIQSAGLQSADLRTQEVGVEGGGGRGSEDLEGRG